MSPAFTPPQPKTHTLRIAVLGTRGFPNVQGGVEKHCENLYPRLVRLGCEVTVFGRAPYLEKIGTVPKKRGQSLFFAPIFYKGVKILPLDCPKNKFLEAFVHTFRGILAAKKLKPDILHIHAIGPSLMIPLARLLGFKVVMTHHGPDYRRKKWNIIAKIVLVKGEWSGCLFANRVIAISQTIAESVRWLCGKKTTVIPNGVTIPEIARTDEALKRFGLEKGRYILAVGRFVPEKGFCELVSAFEKIGTVPTSLATTVSGQSLFSLVIVGDADHEDSYSRELKKKAAETPNVVLTGRLTGTPLVELYSHAGLFVLPSYYEGLPIVLLEAMSYGLPCIVSDIPANREVMSEWLGEKMGTVPKERGQSPFFQPGDIEGLAGKISEFVNRPLTDEEKKRQIDFVAERYDWERIAAATLEVYKSVLP